MKKGKMMVILLSTLIVLISISAVSANNATQDTLEINDSTTMAIDNNEILTVENENASLTALSSDINNSDDKLDIQRNYVYEDGDDTDGVIVKKDNFVINGNNYVIDGKNKTRLFKIDATNLTINNLVLKNGNLPSMILGKNIVTNNVTFINCRGMRGGALYISNSTYASYNDKFIDNYANFGSAIYSSLSNVSVSNGIFKSEDDINWSLIYSYGSDMEIANSTFTNTTSKYATAIYNIYGNLTLWKSRFVNLFAMNTAGAIASKERYNDIIEGCEFINVSSSKNGGAIFFDGGEVQEGNALISSAMFENCSSEFGGAVLSLAMALEIRDSTFINNSADYKGGAFFTSAMEGKIINCSFKDNYLKVPIDYLTYGGGAAYIDNSIITVNDCKFIDNQALNGAGLYFYDCEYHIDNLEFNGNGNAIITFFDDSCEKGKLFGNDTILKSDFNNVYYPSVVSGIGKQLALINNTVNITNIPSRYSLKDEHLLTPVKNQGNMASCWAFAIVGSLESALLKATNVTYCLSENNVQNSMLMYSLYGSNSVYEAADNMVGLGYVLSWFGVYPYNYDDYDELGKISPIITSPEHIHIQDVVLVPYAPGNLDSAATVKQAILKYGALTGNLLFDDEYYNETTYGYYYPEFENANHAICVVGWDDNYSKDNFNTPAPGDGAWIIKNSWGTEWGDEGLFYVSYYDQTLNPSQDHYGPASFIGFIIENTLPYNNNYQYDFSGISDYQEDFKEYIYLNYFEAYQDDVIAGVGTYFDDENVSYKIEVIVNGQLVYTQNGVSPFFGYHTVKLDKYVSVKKGDNFSVAITSDSLPLCLFSRAHYNEATSQSYMGGYWEDESVGGSVCCLKVYTLSNPFITENIAECYSQDKVFAVNVSESNVTVMVSVNGVNITNISDENGIANFKLPLLKPGFYTITTYVNGTAVINTINISSSIGVDEKITVGYNSNSKFTVNFYDAGCKVISSVTIPIYNHIGSYKITFKNYLTSETVTSTVNVVSRLSGNKNINMFYNGQNTYSVKVFGADGKVVGKNVIVTIKINKKTFRVKTNANGMAILKIPNTITPGTYTITATYAGQTVKNTLKVKQVLTSKKTVKVKRTSKKLVLKATLKQGKKVIKGKKITFKFQSKTYSAKTNAKGIAKITIKKNVIKKLKKGKSYAVKITYLKDTIKTTVKVQ